MARIIELCGVPGVGKTSTYSTLKSVWDKNGKWIPAEFLYPRKKVDLKNPKRFVVSLTKKVRGLLEPAELKAAGERFVAAYPEYLDGSWNAIQRKHHQRANTPDNRFEEARRLQRSAEYIQLLNENETSKFAIVDIGGLVQRLDLTWLTSTNIHEDEKEAIQLLKLMPLPAAVVYIHINTERNVERLLGRKKTLGMHRNLTAAELRDFCGKYKERWEMVCDLLADKKIPVLKIDSGLDIEKNVQKIDEFAEALSAESLECTSRTKKDDVLTSR
jgi:hypothetical protein